MLGVTLSAPGRGHVIFLTCEERLSSAPWLFSAILGAGWLEGCRVAAGQSGRVEEIGSLVLKISEGWSLPFTGLLQHCRPPDLGFPEQN